MGVLDDDEDSFFDADDDEPEVIKTEVLNQGQQPLRSVTINAGPVSARFSSSGQSTVRGRNGGRNGRLRIRPMPPGMSRKLPDAATVLVTNGDGRQALYVRGK